MGGNVKFCWGGHMKLELEINLTYMVPPSGKRKSVLLTGDVSDQGQQRDERRTARIRRDPSS